MALQPGPRTHGSLCRQLEVSTGAMTNRLDKLEREGARQPGAGPQRPPRGAAVD